jgi:Helicase associated domain
MGDSSAYAEETMPSEWRRRLEEQGFVWNTHQADWERGFDALLRFKQREETMSAERKKRLDDQGFVWDVLEDQWAHGYGVLLKFSEREGHCRVPPRYLEEDFKLGQWVSVQRHRNKRGKITDEQRRLLAEQGFLWDPHQEAWERGLAALVKVKQREGHCQAKQKRLEGDFNLGSWVAAQKRSFKEGSLSTARIARLEAEGFEWEVAAAPRPNAPSSQAAS